MSELISFFSVQITLLAVVLVLHTYLGLHIIRRTLVFSDLVLDQLAALGALVAVGLGIEYGTPLSYGAALIAVTLGAALLAVLKPRNRQVPREAVIGILYVMALVVSFLLADKMTGGDAYVTKTLAGSLLWVTWPLVGVTVVVYLLLLWFHYYYRDTFIRLCETEDDLPHRHRWDFVFFLTQGIITVLIVPVAGVLLAYAFLMIPAAMAALFTRKWAFGVVLGWVLGFSACTLGLGVSYRWNLPYGPSLILALGLFFIGAVLLKTVWSSGALPDA